MRLDDRVEWENYRNALVIFRTRLDGFIVLRDGRRAARWLYLPLLLPAHVKSCIWCSSGRMVRKADTFRLSPSRSGLAQVTYSKLVCLVCGFLDELGHILLRYKQSLQASSRISHSGIPILYWSVSQ